ncbi:hypothetical protein EYF80_022872 [Liparis tanakae]|uniref:Uncharacterized protein n=1 Tax=Liparis tanakae TaxID=230148 RepID=A0A4Z2HNW7_9TELE|nr:hypothetical protein EYF80_022872 [Liparis tanakae]
MFILRNTYINVYSFNQTIILYSSFQKRLNYFKLGVNEHVIITHFHDFSRTFVIKFFSMTFPGLEMTILKFHDFSRFSMTVRTLDSVFGTGAVHVWIAERSNASQQRNSVQPLWPFFLSFSRNAS